MDDDEHDDCADQADGVPSLLAVLEPIRDDDMERVVPYGDRQFERHPVLCTICAGFLGIPIELHADSYGSVRT